MIRIVFFFLVFLGFSSRCAAQFDEKQAFIGALEYLKKTQEDSTIFGKQYAGEWPSYMELTEAYFFIGFPQKARDSNCFTLSAIYNFLAEIYLKDSSLTQIRPMLEKAMPEIQSYSEGVEFNFWKKLPPLRNHRVGRLKDDLPLVHRPTNFQAKPRLIHKMSNVANDADDTNQANLAKYYHNQIFKTEFDLAKPQRFERWTDAKRQNRNWYNYLFHTKKNSGAYLTWLAQEYRYGFWTPIHGYLSVLGVFVPTSASYPRAYEKWIPWGANDVDPVVNANVLTYLIGSRQYVKNRANRAAAEMITRLTEQKKWDGAGVYYPNAYHLPYAVGRAVQKEGGTVLNEAARNCLKFIEESQLENGAWASRSWVNNGDTLQSSAYAYHALLDLKNAGFEVNTDVLAKAKEFILSQAKHEENTVHWPGGVFFTGGTALRNILFWHSDAYTTALIANALQKDLILAGQ